mgnify:CR=1 FL=1
MPEQNTTDAPETAEASEPADAPASRPLTQRGLDRRRALLMHSADLFIEVGYERTSIREIIARAGGSRSLIYQCFKNKHGLFLACLQMTVDDVYSSYVQEGRKGLTLDEELLTFGRIFLEHMTNRRAQGLLRLIFSETTRFHEIGEWYWREGVMQSWVCFARVMRDYVDLPDEELIDAARFEGAILINQGRARRRVPRQPLARPHGSAHPRRSGARRGMDRRRPGRAPGAL